MIILRTAPVRDRRLKAADEEEEELLRPEAVEEQGGFSSGGGFSSSYVAVTSARMSAKVSRRELARARARVTFSRAGNC